MLLILTAFSLFILLTNYLCWSLLQPFLRLNQERIMGQKANLRALAGICEVHSSYFERL